MRTQTTPFGFSVARGVALAIAALLAATAGAQPQKAELEIDGSSAARFEASVATIQNSLRTFRREEFETALAAIWFGDVAASGDADSDGDHDADDLKAFREDAFDLLTDIQRGNIANAIEQRSKDPRTATEYFTQLDGLESDEVVELASRPEAAEYIKPLWQYRLDQLCKSATIESLKIKDNCRRHKSTAQIANPYTAKMLSEAVEALSENRYDDARTAVEALKRKRLTPYEASKAEQILYNVAVGEQNYAEARTHLQNAVEAGGLNPQELSVAAAQIKAIDAVLAANAP